MSHIAATRRRRPTPRHHWVRKAAAFHRERRQIWRDVIRLPHLNSLTTLGAAQTTAGSLVIGFAATLSWGEVIGGMGAALIVPGYLAGRFLFPIPDQSVISDQGPRELRTLAPDELDALTHSELRAYRNNFELTEGEGSAEVFKALSALRRRERKAGMVGRALGLAYRDLQEPSAKALGDYFRAHHQHATLRKRWLAYEIEPGLQAKAPAMTDPGDPVTVRMIRCLNAADLAAHPRKINAYVHAVDDLRRALDEAERHARLTG